MKKKKNEQFGLGQLVTSFSTESLLQVDVASVDTGLVKWQMFVKAIQAHIDPVLASILFETDFIQFDQNKRIIHLVTLKKFMMFQDLFIEQKGNYQEYLDRIFGFKAMLVVEFVKIAPNKKMIEEKGLVVDSRLGNQEVDRKASSRLGHDNSVGDRNVNDRSVRVSLSKDEKNIDITDKKKWKLTHTLLEHFGGTVREIIKDSNEFDA